MQKQVRMCVCMHVCVRVYICICPGESQAQGQK